MKSLILLVFSLSALVLSGCGGGSNPAAAVAAPASVGNCLAGWVYSAQYGCMNPAGCQAGMAQAPSRGCVVYTATNQNCVTSQVYGGAQYGCLPQGNCPPGQGSYAQSSGQVTCIQAQAPNSYGYGATSCTVGQIMTARYGCEVEGTNGCGPGTAYVSGTCYPRADQRGGMNSGYGNMPDHRYNSLATIDLSINSDSSYETDYDDIDFTTNYYYAQHSDDSEYLSRCVKKFKVKANKIKIKYRRNCR